MERGETEVHRMTAVLPPRRENGSNGLRIDVGLISSFPFS